MKVLIKGKVMEVVSKEYDYNGIKGVSNKLCIYSDSRIYQVVIPQEQVDYFNTLIGDEIEILCNIFVKGTYNLRLVNE